MIKLFENALPEDSIRLTEEILREGWLSEGVTARLFEEKLQRLLTNNRTFTVNSGTSALHLALKLAGIGPNDEVLVPSQTFIATALAVLYVGAHPVIVDVNPLTGEINVEKAKKKITSNTKAVIAVDWGGYPCDYKELAKLGLKVIRDAAHSLLANADYLIDDYVDFTCYSFQAIKLLTTGDGGAVSCRTIYDYERGKRLRWFGIDRIKDKVDDTGERKYNLRDIGYKYHMNNVAAAIGLGQIDNISNEVKLRRNVARAYQSEFCCIPGITLPGYAEDRRSNFWLFPMLVENRKALMAKFAQNDIEVSIVHHGIDRNDIFGGIDDSLVGQRRRDKELLHIPIRGNLSLNDFTMIVNTIRSGW